MTKLKAKEKQILMFVYLLFRYVSSEAKTKTTTEKSRKFNKYFNRNSEQTQQPPNLKQIPQRYDLRNFRLLICLERT